MKKEDYKPRVIAWILPRYLTTFGAVIVEGPNGAGKHGRPPFTATVSICWSVPREIFTTGILLKCPACFVVRVFIQLSSGFTGQSNEKRIHFSCCF